MERRLVMRARGFVCQGQIVDRALGEFTMSTERMRVEFRGNAIRRSKLIMSIVEFVYRLVVAVIEDRRFAVVRIVVHVARLVSILSLKEGWQLLGHHFEMGILLESASAFAGV
jgi:hypothetical protein